MNELNILSLTTNKYAPFYQSQVEALNRFGCDTKTISPYKETNKVDNIGYDRSVLDYLKIWPRLYGNLEDEYDIIHANNAKVAPMALSQIRCPVVVTFWGSELMEKHTTLSRICGRIADEVIVPSSAMSPYLSVSHSVIPFGVDKTIFKPMDTSEARDQLGWSQYDDIVLFPYPKSRKVKRYSLAEEAVSSLDSDVVLKTVSGVPHEDMPVYMNASDVILITSERESGPMVIKEAALCNQPIVSTDVGFVAETLDNVPGSFVCDNKTEIVRCLKQALKYGGNADARSKVEDQCSTEKMAQSILDVYNRALR
ncbi:glycosyltransferase [Halovivax cerinus]|uniref:Glycosyltransferase n=1 Tax=Halovivax cerinus TaxID=1487865 RepID=A0ABD5NQB2_9EURY|nr:glycosyltransferase [Halovivax cerinus]